MKNSKNVRNIGDLTSKNCFIYYYFEKNSKINTNDIVCMKVNNDLYKVINNFSLKLVKRNIKNYDIYSGIYTIIKNNCTYKYNLG
jgi:hypothetical protein